MTTVHGGLDAGELRSLGLRAAEVLDFSSNINPLGASAAVQEAVAEADLSSYPDRHSLVLREALAARLEVKIETILVGNGSTELIHLLARSRLRAGDRCVVFEPTFGEYETAATLAGARTTGIRPEDGRGFEWSVEDAVRTVQRVRPGLVFLCNPNNPTGAYLSRSSVEQILASVGRNGLLLLDDAYVSLADHSWNSTPLLERGNLAILRSMTKDHALAGVRLGYVIAEPTLICGMRNLQPAWSVNSVAQSAGLAALGDEAHLAKAKQVISESKAYLHRNLAGLGIAVTDTSTNFILAKVDSAARMRMALLRRGIAVRDCTSFGLPEHIRIAIRRPEECTLLVEALGRELADDR